MNEEIGEGNATLSVTLCFDQEDAALGTTRAEGGDEGKQRARDDPRQDQRHLHLEEGGDRPGAHAGRRRAGGRP